MEEIARSPIGSTHPGRALVEEIGFTVREGISILSQTAGCTGEFRMSGGQARNDIWVQMKADISGAVFSLTQTSEGELTGNAIIAATALGEYASLAEAAQQMVRITKRYEPDADHHRIYSEKYLAWKENAESNRIAP
jgi:xylulokinase